MTNYIETTDSAMQSSAEDLSKAVVGRRIVRAEREPDIRSASNWLADPNPLTLTLDDGQRVRIYGSGDCCAYTELEAFLLHPDKVEHVITGVKTEDEFQTWHILADMSDVLTMTLGWSEGSGYYSYGFVIEVVPA